MAGWIDTYPYIDFVLFEILGIPTILLLYTYKSGVVTLYIYIRNVDPVDPHSVGSVDPDPWV